MQKNINALHNCFGTRTFELRGWFDELENLLGAEQKMDSQFATCNAAKHLIGISIGVWISGPSELAREFIHRLFETYCVCREVLVEIAWLAASALNFTELEQLFGDDLRLGATSGRCLEFPAGPEFAMKQIKAYIASNDT